MKKGLKMLLFSIVALTLFSNCKKEKDNENKEDRAGIEKIIQEEATTWNNGDAEGYSRHFAQDGTFTNILGMFAVGYQPFLEAHKRIFQTVFLHTKLRQEVVSMKFLQSNIVVVETISWVSEFGGDPIPGTYLDDKGRLRVRLLQVMVKKGSEWEIVAYHNVDIKPGIPSPEPH